MVVDDAYTLTVVFTKESGKKDNDMVMEKRPTRTEKNIKAPITTEKCTGMAFLHGQTAESTKASFLTAKKKAKAYSIILTAANTLGNSKMESNMDGERLMLFK